MANLTQSALLGLDLADLTALVQQAGEKSYRARQLFEGLYEQRVESLDAITTLSKEFRQKLTDLGHVVGMPKIAKRFVSIDGTVRYLIEMADGLTVETVWMPEGDGGEAGDGSEAGEEELVAESTAENNANVDVESSRLGDAVAPAPTTATYRRATICVSSQVGCAVDCKFCLTALLGVKRNLTAGEIVGQIIVVLNDQGANPPHTRMNVVYMGMGEPFLNYANFIKSVRLLAEVHGVGIPASRITVSTSGIVPRITEMGQEAVRPKLAISLNASNDGARREIMPITRKWSVEQLIAAARAYPLKPREWVTFEYVLLAEVNDGAEHAREVVKLIAGIKSKVNLIALNPGPGIDFRTPGRARVLEFQSILVRAGIQTYIRRPRGRDIYAACGQLKRTEELVEIG